MNVFKIPSYPVYTTAGVPGVAVSSTTTYIGTPTIVPAATDVSYVVQFTGTPVGTLSIEVSNASNDDVTKGADLWVPYTGVTLPAISGATSFGVELKRCGYGRVRLKYVNASSTGTVFATLCAKGS